MTAAKNYVRIRTEFRLPAVCWKITKSAPTDVENSTTLLFPFHFACSIRDLAVVRLCTLTDMR